MQGKITLKDGFNISNKLPFTLIAGPCQIENLNHALFMADQIKAITDRLGIAFIYKSSFDKANRTSFKTSRGVGLDAGLEILSKVKSQIQCSITTDVHNEYQCKAVGDVVDILQIPAFLSRQTDLLHAAAVTQKIVNVKKGQFLSAWEMRNVYDKLVHFGTNNIIFTERGTSFGYHNLVSDMRGLHIMKKIDNVPVFFDATHSIQLPGIGSQSGGEREFIEVLARCAISVGIAGIFMEVHQDPDTAPSDAACMLKLDMLEKLLINLQKYDRLSKE
ncbi:3-deoxy-8-phosphooctulonate synthase [Rickettsia endosymbiont of Cardiosporidium cionae]|uniref:3-deoxy-8-phosphooctulonate synthase n=1 Tax=Rickettsia endosymbiont of Cardiosporidium cionae TaxID=2777155 RepID=UPI00189580BA|nr:3-deoxy-8-phosphooctulonate synthase [Rickettsia endosymbiont of Cardiosporidium cionae]